jgi:cobalamin biosynthesis Co2+ chelatase CbiK
MGRTSVGPRKIKSSSRKKEYTKCDIKHCDHYDGRKSNCCRKYVLIEACEIIKNRHIETEAPAAVPDTTEQDHYTACAIEPIDFITANGFDFLEGNVIKYVSRYKHKNGLEDLAKARDYLNRLIDREAIKNGRL